MGQEYEAIFADYLREHGYVVFEDREQAIERMARFWREDRGECKDDYAFFSALLAAAEGRET